MGILYVSASRSGAGVTAETTLGTKATNWPTTGLDAIQLHQDGGAQITTKYVADTFADKNGLTRLGRIPKARTTSWTINRYLRPGPTLGTGPDGGAIYTSGGFTASSNASDAVQAGSPTATTFDVVDGSQFSAGELLLVDHTTDGPTVVRIKSIATNTLTTEPAFSAAPTASDGVDNGISYKLNETAATNQNSFSLGAWQQVDQITNGAVSGFSAFGCVPGSYTWTFGNDVAAMETIEGNAKQGIHGAQTDLAAEFTKASTTITLADASNFEDGMTVICESEGILLGTKSGNTFTGCSRAYGSVGTDATHASGTPVYVYHPTLSYQSQAPVSSVVSNAYVYETDSSRPDTICINSCTVSLDMAIEGNGPCVGDTDAFTSYQTGQRTGTITIEGYFVAGDEAADTGGTNKNTARYIGLSEEGADVGVLLVLGTPTAAGGGVWAFSAPQCKILETPEIADSGTGQIPISIQFEMLGTTTRNDEFSMASL